MSKLAKGWKIAVRTAYGIVSAVILIEIWAIVRYMGTSTENGAMFGGAIGIAILIPLLFILLPLLEPMINRLEAKGGSSEKTAIIYRTVLTVFRVIITVPALIVTLLTLGEIGGQIRENWHFTMGLFQPRVIGGYTKDQMNEWESRFLQGDVDSVLIEIGQKNVTNDIQLVKLYATIMKRASQYDKPFFSKDTVALQSDTSSFYPSTPALIQSAVFLELGTKYILEGYGKEKKKNRLSKFISDEELKKGIAVSLELMGQVYNTETYAKELIKAAKKRFPSVKWAALYAANMRDFYPDYAEMLKHYNTYLTGTKIKGLRSISNLEKVNDIRGRFSSNSLLTLAALGIKDRQFAGDTAIEFHSEQFSPYGSLGVLKLFNLQILLRGKSTEEFDSQLSKGVGVDMYNDEQLPFASINTAFITAACKLIPEPSQKMFGISAKELFKIAAREDCVAMYASLMAMEKANMLNDAVYEAYISASRNGIESVLTFTYDNLIPHLNVNSDEVGDASGAMLFWLRRWKDGSLETLKTELATLLRKYDPSIISNSPKYIKVLSAIDPETFTASYGTDEEGYEEGDSDGSDESPADAEPVLDTAIVDTASAAN